MEIRDVAFWEQQVRRYTTSKEITGATVVLHKADGGGFVRHCGNGNDCDAMSLLLRCVMLDVIEDYKTGASSKEDDDDDG